MNVINTTELFKLMVNGEFYVTYILITTKKIIIRHINILTPQGISISAKRPCLLAQVISGAPGDLEGAVECK